MRKVVFGSIVLALIVSACTQPAATPVVPTVKTTAAESQPAPAVPTPTPLDRLTADVHTGSYGTLTADRSEPAKAYYRDLMAAAAKLVGYSHDAEGQALLDFLKGRAVLVPLAPSVPRVGTAVRGALELPVILVSRADYLSPDGFWGAGLAGGDAQKVEITAGRFWSGLNAFILRSDLQADGWTASVTLHEARHAMDARERGDSYMLSNQWEGERRAYDLQIRLIRAWGGAAYEKWVASIEQEQATRGLDLTGVGSGPTPTPDDMKRWLGQLVKVFGPIPPNESLNAISFALMGVIFRGKSDSQKEEMIKAIYGALGY